MGEKVSNQEAVPSFRTLGG